MCRKRKRAIKQPFFASAHRVWLRKSVSTDSVLFWFVGEEEVDFLLWDCKDGQLKGSIPEPRCCPCESLLYSKAGRMAFMLRPSPSIVDIHQEKEHAWQIHGCHVNLQTTWLQPWFTFLFTSNTVVLCFYFVCKSHCGVLQNEVCRCKLNSNWILFTSHSSVLLSSSFRTSPPEGILSAPSQAAHCVPRFPV